jgi:hypothetical protein
MVSTIKDNLVYGEMSRWDMLDFFEVIGQLNSLVEHDPETVKYFSERDMAFFSQLLTVVTKAFSEKYGVQDAA